MKQSDSSPPLPSPQWTVSFGTLTLVAICLCIGAAGAELLRNIAGAQEETFSTTALIGFVLSVVLSSASIVLAIAAIWIGKVTELSIIRRSDESIRLQNEVFVRTAEALQRIEASTGVTEKRIEDMIQGRAGDISHKIAELTKRRSGALRDSASFEDEIRKSILRSIRSEPAELTTKNAEALRARAEKRRQRYRDYHRTLLQSFAGIPNATVLKSGDGQFHGEGHELFDVVIDRNGEQIAASALTAATALDSDFTTYLHDVAKALQANQIQHVVLAIDGEASQREKVEKAVSGAFSLFKGDPINQVSIITVPATGLGEAIAGLYPA